MAYSILGCVKPFFLVLVLCACQRGRGRESRIVKFVLYFNNLLLDDICILCDPMQEIFQPIIRS